MAPLFPDLGVLDLSGSEDEFPDVLELVRRQKVKGKNVSPVKKKAVAPSVSATEGTDDTDKENVTAATPAPKRSPVKLLSKTPMTAATPMRRRKLGLSEKVFTNSLLQPWNESDMAQEEEEEEEGSRTVKAKTPFVRSRDTSRADISDYSMMSVGKPQTARKHRPALLIDSSDDEDNSLSGLSKLSNHKPFDGSPSKRMTARPNRVKKMPLYSLGESETEGSSFDRTGNESSTMSKYEDGSEFLSSQDANTTSDETYNSTSELFGTPSKKKKPTRSPSKKASKAKLSTRAIAIKAVDNSDMDLEAQFNKLTIFNETDMESASDKNEIMGRPTTPSKDNKALRLSPTKSPNRIPKSPWKAENKEFWDPEVNFNWIDKHSPQREAPSPKKKRTLMTSKALNLNDAEDLRKHGNSPQKREAKKAFDLTKDEVAQKFLQELDDRVTDGRLAQLTNATGGLRTVWSNTLQTTAGRAHWRCKTITTPASSQGSEQQPAKHNKQHEAYIELAHKVLTNEADLLQTVAHEFCHLATFMLEPAKVAAHGPEFKAWGRKCGATFGTSHGIDVTTKHRYEIDYKFVWRCADCTVEVSRHSRSVDPKRQRCGACKGTLVQIKPKPRGAAVAGEDAVGDKKAPGAKPKSAWQQFHSKTMKELSVTHKGMALQQKMEIVSARWKEHQAAEREKAQNEEKQKQQKEEQEQAQQQQQQQPEEDDDEEQIQMQLQMEISQQFEQEQQQPAPEQQKEEDPEVEAATEAVETLEILDEIVVGGVPQEQDVEVDSTDAAAPPSLTSSFSTETEGGEETASQDTGVNMKDESSEVEIVAVVGDSADVREDGKVFD